MSETVLIEGSRFTPSDRLGRGVRAKVELTDDIRKLVKIGAVIIVDQPVDLRTERVWTPGDPAILPEVPASAYGPDSTPLAPVERSGPSDEAFATGTDTAADQSTTPPQPDLGPKPPAKNAATSDWKAWVAAHVPDVDVEKLTRDELIEVWTKFDGE